jgi:hypothetical protein
VVVEFEGVEVLADVEEVDDGSDVDEVSGTSVVDDPLDPPEHALTTISVANATPTRNGGRVGPPVLSIERRWLTGLPPFPSHPNPTLPKLRALSGLHSRILHP